MPGDPTMNAIDLLIQQHQKTRKALHDLAEAESADPAMLQKAGNELVAHMVIEEHVFYPRIRELGEDLVEESFEEHAVARFELARAMIAKGDQQKARLTVLEELVKHHVEEEEKEMLPKVRKAIPEEELVRLGQKMQIMFEKAVAMGFEKLVTGPGELGRVLGQNGGGRGRAKTRGGAQASRGRAMSARAH